MAASRWRLVPVAACFVLPFVLLWWMVPFVTGLTLGNDYPRYSIQWQQELWVAWQGGEWPLYVPGFAGGQAAAGLSLGQLHHPLAWLASWMPGYWSGHALEWCTLWRLCSLGAVHWAWWALLRRWGWRTDVAFAVGLVLVYHLRMLDWFRYGAALEGWTGMLFLCAACGAHGLAGVAGAPARRWRTLLAMVGATYWLVTSGHPQVTYFGLMGAVGFAAAWPWLLRLRDGGNAPSPRRYYAEAGTALAAGAVLSAWFVAPYYLDFVRSNAGRVGAGYAAWAVQYADLVPGVLANFALPFHADVHGAFGGATLLAAWAFAPLLGLFRWRLPAVGWAIWAAGVVVLLIACGPATPVHWVAWKVLPGYANFRVPGRITMLLPLATVCLALIASHGPVRTWRLGGQQVVVPPLAALVGLTLLGVLGAGIALQVGEFPTTGYAPVVLRGAPFLADLAGFVIGAAACIALAVRLGIGDHARWMGPVAIGLFAVQLTVWFHWGTWVEWRRPTPTLAELRARRARTWEVPYAEGLGLYSKPVAEQLARGLLEPRLAYVARSTEPVGSVDLAFAARRTAPAPDTAVVVTTMVPAPPLPATARPSVQVRRAGYNRLVLETQSPAPAWLVVNYPYSDHWSATGAKGARPVVPANGLCCGIFVGAGTDTVELRYESPAAAGGVCASAAMAAAIGAWLGWWVVTGRRRWWVWGGAALLALGGPIGWRWSLYRGDCGYRYTWTAPPPGPHNLAYGRSVVLSSLVRSQEPHHTYGGRAVDGDVDGRPAVTDIQPANAACTVDLGSVQPLARCVLHEVTAGALFDTRPLSILVSPDGERWQRAAVWTTPPGAGLTTIALPSGTTGRFVRVQCEERGRIGLREFEVFGE